MAYGVLGQPGASKSSALPPALAQPRVAIVDPAGLNYIKNGPKGAGGAAGSIYKHLGIARNRAFPKEVRDAIVREGDASHYRYRTTDGVIDVVHVVGPDLRVSPPPKEEEAIAWLAHAYGAVLREFLRVAVGGDRLAPTPTTLRLLPVSGGIFAGTFARRMPQLTRAALGRAFINLPEAKQRALLDPALRFEMCIFSSTDEPAFRAAFAASDPCR